MKKGMKKLAVFLVVSIIAISNFCFAASAEVWIIPNITAAVNTSGGTITLTVPAHDSGAMVSADVTATTFANASVVNITNGTVLTSAIVENGKIYFKAPQGTFTATQGVKTVTTLNNTSTASASSAVGSTYTTNNYKGDGTAQNPYTILADLSSLTFQSSWKTMNNIAGYESNGTNPTQIKQPYCGDIEYRDKVTGFLYASLFIDGSKWSFTPSTENGPYLLAYIKNPDDATIASMISSGNYADGTKPDAQTLINSKAVADSMLFFCKANGGKFKGPITYKLYVGDKFASGDVLQIDYALGAMNKANFHGTVPADSALVQTNNDLKASYGQKIFVDSAGYISFDLLNGGFFTFTKIDSMKTYSDIEAKINSLSDNDYTDTSYSALISALGDYKTAISTKTKYSDMTSALSTLKSSFNALEAKAVKILEAPAGISNPGLISVKPTAKAFDNPVDIRLKSDDATKQAIQKALSEQAPNLPKNAVIFPLDISVYNSGTDTKVQPNTGTSVTITCPIPQELLSNKESIVVVCVIDGKLVILPTKIIDIDGIACVQFTGSHFSPYALVVDTSHKISDTTNPKTGYEFIFIPAIIVLVSGMFVLKTKIKNK